MKKRKLAVLFVSILMAAPCVVQAQLLKLNVADTALQKRTLIAIPAIKDKGPRMFQPQFDAKGNYVYNDTLPNGYFRYLMGFNQKVVTAFLKRGKTLKIKVLQKQGKVVSEYSGDGSDVCRLLDAFNDGYSYPKYFSLTGDQNEILANYDNKLTMLDKYHADFAVMINKLKEKELIPQIKLMNECEYLRNRLALMRCYDRSKDIDVIADEAFQKLLGSIDLNDPEYESYSLISTFVRGKVSSKYDDDPATYGIEFVKVANKYLKNAEIKKSLEMAILNYVTQRCAGDDIDKFWVPYKAVGDSEIVKAYSYKIEAMKNTKAGTVAPDDEFADKDGKLHRFSDYKGKLLYVDFWATWCGPCKAEIPHLAKLVEHYKDNPNIQFISVSLDTNVEAWKKMITDDAPAWPQFIADKEQNEKISKDWGIAAIPRFIMINPDGTINSADALRPSDSSLIPLLDKLLK